LCALLLAREAVSRRLRQVAGGILQIEQTLSPIDRLDSVLNLSHKQAPFEARGQD